MSFMDQNSVDDLLAQIQSDADSVKASAAPADAPAVAAAAKSAASVLGDIEQPPAPAPAHASGGAALSDLAPEVHRLLAIEVPVIVQLGVRRMTVAEVMRLGAGAIVEFNKSAEEELDLLANNKPIGKGHAVKVGENFGIKITHIGSVKETIRKLGGI